MRDEERLRNENDFHCHLDMKDFSENAEEIIDGFFRESSGYIITVADPYEEKSHERTLRLLALNDRIFAMTAAHPHNADNYTTEIEKKILNFFKEDKIIGIGEAGLDFYYDLSKRDNQISVFKRQIAIANELQVPLTIHSREAEPLVLKILEEEKFDQPVIFHCYTGNMEDAMEIIKRGYHISISGIATFKQKKTDYLREVVKLIPLDRIFIETDSPYLAPEPHRGKTNTPLFIRHTVEKIAELKKISVKKLNTVVKENIERLFLTGN
jgi:TatD DNase family protein